MSEYTMILARQQKSLRNGDTMPMARINFNLQQDKDFERTKSILKRVLRTIEPYSKIYIDAHSGNGSEELEQHYLTTVDSEKISSSIKYQQLADIFSLVLADGSKANLCFHFLACSANYFAKKFIEELHAKHHFENCIAISYNNTVTISYQRKNSMRMSLKSFIINDFTTKERITEIDGQSIYRHHRNTSKGDIDDNKQVSYVIDSHGETTVQQVPYRQVKNTVKSGNFFLYPSLKSFLTTPIPPPRRSRTKPPAPPKPSHLTTPIPPPRRSRAKPLVPPRPSHLTTPIPPPRQCRAKPIPLPRRDKVPLILCE